MTKALTWRCCNRQLALGRGTLIMGILNVTPDSFSDGGQYDQLERAVERALNMQAEGADIIDIGGESTRPFSEPVAIEEELRRIIPVIEALQGRLSVPISVDTTKSAVARRALAAGAVIVNDISGLSSDAEMPAVLAESGAGVVLMHIKGTPRDMQQNPHYLDLVAEVSAFLAQQRQRALDAGILADRVVIDPGLGFGKSVADNFTLLRELRRFLRIGAPVLIGPSRKSFIGKTLNVPADQRLQGTAAAVTAAILNGAHIVRVHDVLAMKHVAGIADAIMGVL